jgi:methanogenic corrinoid protein MtbC1
MVKPRHATIVFSFSPHLEWPSQRNSVKTSSIKLFSISQIELETGLTKDMLRKWEIRYDFPKPSRGKNGDRLFTMADLQRLRAIKRLLDRGRRPSEIVALSTAGLASVEKELALEPDDSPEDAFVGGVVSELASNAPISLRARMQRILAEQGLRTFAISTLHTLNHAIGDAWEKGTISIHEEHVYSEVARSLMGEAITHLSCDLRMPRVVLTTPPGELHGLGLLGVHALFALAGSECVSLGTQTPASDVAAAARHYKADIIAISFSAFFPARRISPYLENLKAHLAGSASIWAGGSGIDKRNRQDPGVSVFASLEAAVAALAALRKEPPAGTGTSNALSGLGRPEPQ